MLLECESCGAPLDVQDGVSVVRCHYCGRSAAVDRFRQVAQVTPAGFVPPREWTPPASASVPSRPLTYRPRAVRRGGCGAVMALVIAGVVGFVAWRATGAVDALTITTDSTELKSMLSQALSAASAAVDVANQQKQLIGGGITGDTVPVICSGNDAATITGKVLSMPAGVPVIASGNCRLRLVNCTVTGVTGISATGNASVTVEGGTIAGKGPAIVLMGNTTLDVSGGASLTGDMTVTAAANAHARVRASSITGTHYAVQASGNASVDTETSKVTGRVLGRHSATGH
ncbi:MAG TPA: hypothetical protein VH062_31060 [Polyangiaceae bacterium]|nr:hypothetical protein [Polyangiaceae bacterium]